MDEARELGFMESSEKTPQSPGHRHWHRWLLGMEGAFNEPSDSVSQGSTLANFSWAWSDCY